MSDQHQTNLRFIASFDRAEERIKRIEKIIEGMRKLLQEDLEERAKS